MKSIHIITFSMLIAFSTQANAACKVKAIPGGGCPKTCLKPVNCKDKDIKYMECQQKVMKYFFKDAGGAQQNCAVLCGAITGPFGFTIKCDEGVQSKVK